MAKSLQQLKQGGALANGYSMPSSTSLTSGDQSYRIPNSTGGFINADPIKFCLRFRPPTIAIVYQPHSRPSKKYVREFQVHELNSESCDLEKVCEKLFEREFHYFNPQKISKIQVLELMQKLHSQMYPKGVNKENQQRKQNFLEKKRFIDYGENAQAKEESGKVGAGTTILGSSAQNKAPEPAKKDEEEEDDDDYDNDPWEQDDHNKRGSNSNGKHKKKEEVIKHVAPPSQIIDKKEKDNGLIVDNDFGDDFDEDEEEQETPVKPNAQQPNNAKIEDIFEQPNNGQVPKGEKVEEDQEVDEAEQEKIVQIEFQKIFDNDPELRKVIGADANSLTIDEKYQILSAYMQGGGVQGLLYDGASAQQEGDDEFDEEDVQAIEAEFKLLYETDAKLRSALGGPQVFTTLSLREKYQVIDAYKRGGGVDALLEEGGATGKEEEEESSEIIHEGRKYKLVQIEGEAQEYLMDEAGNIYDTDFQYVGQANGSDEEEEGA